MFALLLLAMGLIVANAAEAVGAVGPQGPTGKKGPTGDKGLRGDKGATGNTGATGATGRTGAAGPKGGAKGDQGLPGDKGLQGDKGDAGTQIANGTHTGDTLVWNGSAWTPVTIPSYSAPVVVDANGVYIGTFLQEAGDSSVYTQFTEQNPCWNSQTGALNCNQELYTLIFPTGYQIKLSDNRGEITSFHQTTGYENSTCSGSATLVGNSNLINPIKNLVFKVISYDNRRINQDILESGDYYFPSTPVPYTGPVYRINYNDVTYPCIPAGDPDDGNTTYYKPLINDPSVTGYDPAIINALQKPFRVSID